MENSKKAFVVRYRWLFLMGGVLLFLPPLALLFQTTTGDIDFCGRWCPRMFFAWRKGTGMKEFLGGISRAAMGVGLVAAVLATTLFFGRWWCSHLCPVCGATELASRLVPKFLRIDFSRVPAVPIRYGYLAAYLIAPAIGIGSLCCSYCSFAAVPRLAGAAFVPADLLYFVRTAGIINLLLLLGLGILSRGGRTYCNLLCPVGALDGIANRLGARFGRRVRVEGGKCDACGSCREACPVGAVAVGEKAEIDHLSCIPCRECEKVCGSGAIYYGAEKR